jgi:predicted ATP-dependent protease
LSGDQGVIIPDSNVKDLMLRKDVVEAVKEGKFMIYSVKCIDEGIEILTGKEAGKLQAGGRYPEETINFLVDRKLKVLAEGIKEFGGGTGEEGKKEKNA